MDYATVVAVVFGSITLCVTIIICTVRVTSRIVSMEGLIGGLTIEVSHLRRQQLITVETVSEHSTKCDTDRTEFSTKLDSHERRLNKHSTQIGGLGAT